jgi:pimeloyl-ACP methyl ester carboxylesterase
MLDLDLLQKTIRLSDNRVLSYVEYGLPEGKPVFYFHGSPGSNLELMLFENLEEVVKRLKLRIIALNRPGFGLSSFMPGRKISDWPTDISQAADQLEINRFAILSYSAGGPYLAACARFIPERITKAVMVSGTCPFSRPGAYKGMGGSKMYWGTARIHPVLTRLLLHQAVQAPATPPASQQAAMMSQPDYEMVIQPGFFEKFFKLTFAQACLKSTRGPAHDARLLTQSWGFNPEEITFPIELWHGELDQNAPFHQAQYMSQAISGAVPHFYAGEGHITLFTKYFETILNSLI